MTDRETDDEQLVGHDSTTIPGGEKDLPTGDPGRTPGKAEGDETAGDDDGHNAA